MDNPINLIIGPTGSIGMATARSLLEMNQNTRFFGRNINKIRKFYPDNDQFKTFIGGITEIAALEKAAEGVTHIYYCLNVPYHQWYQKAVPFLKTCLKVAAKQKAKVIFPGNVYVYGHAQRNPVDETHPHQTHTRKGNIRIKMEQQLANMHQEFGNDYVIVRMPDFYGPYVINGFSENFYLNALRHKPLNWPGDLHIPTEMIFIEDAGKAMTTAGLSNQGANTDYNIPGYQEITVRKYLEMIRHYANSNSKISSTNSSIMITLAGLFNQTVREYKEMMYLKTERLLLSGEKYQKTFGPLPTTTYDLGIQKTLNWTREFYKL